MVRCPVYPGAYPAVTASCQAALAFHCRGWAAAAATGDRGAGSPAVSAVAAADEDAAADLGAPAAGAATAAGAAGAAAADDASNNRAAHTMGVRRSTVPSSRRD